MSIPVHISKYEVRRELGKGAMGTVYEGFDPVIERPVAIKTILADYLQNVESESAAARFRREAQVGGKLQHPGIVGVYEYGEDETMAFIVMEYVQGRDLRTLLRERGRLELIDVYEVMRQLLAALDYSHKQDVVHRDIKPTNVMVLDGMKIKVMDFGIAKIQSSSLTQVGTVVGTPTHIAPEQLLGLSADRRVDLWAAGVILYEMLTGRAPFIADTPAAVMHKVLQLDPTPPSSLIPSIPPAFDAVVARALAKQPEDRFQTAGEFSKSLVAAFIRGKSPTENGQVAEGSRERPRSGTDARRRTDESRAPRTEADRLDLRPETLAEIESTLVNAIGPLGKHLVRSSAARAKTLQEFCSLLADNVPEGWERVDFLRRIEKLEAFANGSPEKPSTVASSSTKATFDPATLATAERQLAQHVGPLAKVLIKRAANDSGNVKELYRKLAEHIDSEAERVSFLKNLG